MKNVESHFITLGYTGRAYRAPSNLDVMRRFHNLGEMGLVDTTGSFELLGIAKYFVLAFSIVCAFLGYSMWRLKNNRILAAAILAVLVFGFTYAINTWVVITAYTPVLENGG